MKKNKVILLLLLIIMLGAFLRFYNIGEESFWLDESATALTIKEYSANEISANIVQKGQILPDYYQSNVDLPIYYIILEYWSNIFGLNEASLRAFSALFGALSILLVFTIAKELFDNLTALIASLLFSISAVMIEYSQEARLYSFLIFITLACAYFLLKSLKEKRNSHIVSFIVFNALGIYTHYPFLFFVLFEIGFLSYIFVKDYFNKNKIKLNKIHTAALTLTLLYLPLLPRIMNPKLVATHFTGAFSFVSLAKLFIQLNTWIYPPAELRDKLDLFQFGILNFAEWVLIISVLGISAILTIFFLKNILNREFWDEKTIFLLSWLAIPFILAFATLYKSIFTFGTLRHFVFIVPPYIMLAARSISALKKKSKLIIISLLLLLSIPILFAYYENIGNPDYRQAAAYLESKANNELILTNLPSVAVPTTYYSQKPMNMHGIENSQEAMIISSNANSLWLILSTKHADKDGLIKNYLDENYKLTESKEFFDVRLYHYSKQR